MNFFKLFLPLVAGTFFIELAQAQNADNIYSQFDSETGKQNSALYNGRAYVNPFRFGNETHNYFGNDAYVAGSVFYDGQLWTDATFKYDIHGDNLIIRSIGEYDYMGITLTPEKTASFSIYDKKFVNLKLLFPELPAFMPNGYLEEITLNDAARLYIKHHKNKRGLKVNVIMYDVFESENQYFLFTNGAYFPINSKSDLIAIFPNYKSKINKYYSANRKTAKSDENKFMENLLIYIYAINPNATN
jgi:hypothetical protein